MTEKVLILVSLWRAKDIEVILEKIKISLDAKQQRQLIEEFLKRMYSRADLKISGVFYKKYSFFHGK